MKKVLAVAAIIAMTTSMSFAATSFGNSFKNAVKQDIQNTKSDLKEAVKKDMEAKTQAKTSASQAKKAEKIKQIDAKLAELNKELATVKNDKKITETERVLKMRPIQRQIDFYTRQKQALQ